MQGVVGMVSGISRGRIDGQSIRELLNMYTQKKVKMRNGTETMQEVWTVKIPSGFVADLIV